MGRRDSVKRATAPAVPRSSLLCNDALTDGDATTSPRIRGERDVKHLLPLACLALLYTSTANAEPSLRCKGRLVPIGVPAAYVLSECGAPTNQTIQEATAREGTVFGGSRIVGLTLSEQWVYERGWGRFPAVLIFLDGTLKRIDFLPHRSDRPPGAFLKALRPLLSLLLVASAHAEPAEWLEGTVLADCAYCKTDSFQAERRQIANQAGSPHDAASGTGYIVTIDANGRFVWGRAALVGTGNLIRTDAHVLFEDTGVFKNRDGKIYFEPMHHSGPGDRIEIERFSVQRGGALSTVEPDVGNDWAIARLREDAIEKFDGDRVFAFLWDERITHDDLVKRDLRSAAVLVASEEHTFDVEQSCRSVTDDDPSRYAFGVEEVFLLRC